MIRLGRLVRGGLVARILGREPECDLAFVDFLIPLLCFIRNREGNLIRMQPTDGQLRYASRRSFRNIILKARQVGMTSYICARYLLRTLLVPGTTTVQVAHTLDAAQMIFRIVMRLLAYLPEGFTRIARTEKANVREIVFTETDSRYRVETAGATNAGRGLTIQNLHLSEYARWPGRPAETLAGLLAAVPASGWVDIESTPDGMENDFHKEWVLAVGGDSEFTPQFLPWWVEPTYCVVPGPEFVATQEENLLMLELGLTLGQVAWRRENRRRFGVWAAQEFPDTDVDCFLSSQTCVFPLENVLGAARKHTRCEMLSSGLMQMHKPLKNGRYIIGADPAEGSESGDYSAAVVIEQETGLQVAEAALRCPIADFAEKLDGWAKLYNRAVVIVERNNHGHAVLYALKNVLATPRVWADPVDQKPGMLTTPATRPAIIQALATIWHYAPQCITGPRTIAESQAFVFRAGKPEAAPGAHDDLITAAAMAFYGRQIGAVCAGGVTLLKG